MTEAEAVALVKTQAATDTYPPISDADVLAAVRRTVRAAAWAANTAIAAGAGAVPTVRNLHRYTAGTGGTTGATEPSWPTSGGAQVRDGAVLWVEAGADPGELYDADRATAEVWRLKASRVTGDINFGSDGQSFSPGALQAKCLAAAQAWMPLGLG